MKILQINNFEAVGGGSERVYQLTSSMLMNRGHQVASLSCGVESFDSRKSSTLLTRNGYVESNPFKTINNIRNFIYRPESAAAIDGLIEKFRPDIAHLHIFYGQLSSSVLAALRRAGVPCVMTVHEYRMLCPISTLYTQREGVCERCATGEKRHALQLRCNRGSTFASALSAGESWFRDKYFNYTDYIDHFFMVSRFCLEKHAEYISTIKEKSSVLYNFIADKDLPATPLVSRQKTSFLYAGRLSHEKGVDLLCRAFEQRSHLQLRLAGHGPLAEELKARYKHCANIQFLGGLSSDALKLEMREAKFCVVPSEWYENNPMSILESFAAGTAVIGANIGGIPELVQPNTTGLLFTPSSGDSLLDALDTAAAMPAEVVCELGRNAQDLIRLKHSESVYYEKLLAGYEEAMRTQKRAD